MTYYCKDCGRILLVKSKNILSCEEHGDVLIESKYFTMKGFGDTLNLFVRCTKNHVDEIDDIIHMENGKDKINTICYIPLSCSGIESSDTIVGVTCVDCLQIMEIYSRNGINYERMHRLNETSFREWIK